MSLNTHCHECNMLQTDKWRHKILYFSQKCTHSVGTKAKFCILPQFIVDVKTHFKNVRHEKICCRLSNDYWCFQFSLFIIKLLQIYFCFICKIKNFTDFDITRGVNKSKFGSEVIDVSMKTCSDPWLNSIHSFVCSESCVCCSCVMSRMTSRPHASWTWSL